MNQTPLKEVITSKEFYTKDDGESYNALSDYIHEECKEAPIQETNTPVMLDIALEDCYLLDGALFVPETYEWTHKGTNDTDDNDEYTPKYSDLPNLTEDEVNELVDRHNCDHQCTSNCRREGCNCRCGEYHGDFKK